MFIQLIELFHHQFLGRHGTILFNDIDEIDALMPVGGIDINNLVALLFTDLLANKVIHFHLGHISAFHGDLAVGRVGVKCGERVRLVAAMPKKVGRNIVAANYQCLDKTVISFPTRYPSGSCS